MNARGTRVGVSIPVYNVSPYLRECLDSMLAQTHKNFVAYLVDDGSTDDSGAICDEYAARDSRFVVIHQKNAGISAARNTALDAIEADGQFDWIAYIDSDDYVAPDYLEKLVEAGISEDVDYVICNTTTFNHGEEPVERKYFVPMGRLDHDNVLKHYLGLDEWRRYKSKKKSVFSKLFSARAVGGLRFDVRYKTGEDVRYFAEAAPRLSEGVLVDRSIYFYRVRPGSAMTARHGDKQLPTPVGARKPVVDENGRPIDLMLETKNLYLAQAQKGTHLYDGIHGLLLDDLWGRLKGAYVKGTSEDIKAAKARLREEMRGGEPVHTASTNVRAHGVARLHYPLLLQAAQETLARVQTGQQTA